MSGSYGRPWRVFPTRRHRRSQPLSRTMLRCGMASVSCRVAWSTAHRVAHTEARWFERERPVRVTDRHGVRARRSVARESLCRSARGRAGSSRRSAIPTWMSPRCRSSADRRRLGLRCRATHRSSAVGASPRGCSTAAPKTLSGERSGRTPDGTAQAGGGSAPLVGGGGRCRSPTSASSRST